MKFKSAKKAYRSKKSKRDWHVSASVPLFGKFSAGYKAKRGLNSMIRNFETPYRLALSDNTFTTSIKANGIQTINLSAMINQGSLGDQRQNDEIYLESLKMRNRYTYINSTIAGTTSAVRLLVLKCTAQYATSGWGSGLGISNLFVYDLPHTAYTGAVDITNGIIDKRCCDVLYDGFHTLTPTITESAGAGNNVSKYEHVTVPINQKFTYEQLSSYGKRWNLYVVVMGSAFSATTGTDTVADLYFNGELFFKQTL